MMLMPVPVVVDADVLIRNVEYTIRDHIVGDLTHGVPHIGREARGMTSGRSPREPRHPGR